MLLFFFLFAVYFLSLADFSPSFSFSFFLPCLFFFFCFLLLFSSLPYTHVYFLSCWRRLFYSFSYIYFSPSLCLLHLSLPFSFAIFFLYFHFFHLLFLFFRQCFNLTPSSRFIMCCSLSLSFSHCCACDCFWGVFGWSYISSFSYCCCSYYDNLYRIRVTRKNQKYSIHSIRWTAWLDRNADLGPFQTPIRSAILNNFRLRRVWQ